MVERMINPRDESLVEIESRWYHSVRMMLAWSQKSAVGEVALGKMELVPTKVVDFRSVDLRGSTLG